MNLSFFIAKRYLLAKKSHNAINIITLISVLVVALGTTALILILSVFNGLGSLISSLYGSFDSDFKITPKQGKYINLSDFPSEKIIELEGVANYTRVLEDIALLKYQNAAYGDEGRQFLATLKGVEPSFKKMTGVDTMLVDGQFLLENKQGNFLVLGNGVAARLQIRLNDYENPINVYFPKGESLTNINPLEAFAIESVFPSGVFSIQQEYDDKYVLCSFRFAQNLMNKPNQATSIEIGISKNTDSDKLQSKIQTVLSEKYKVQNRFQQKEMVYKIMKSEKWSSFMILGFILLIAIFNVVGSITVLIIEKKKDIVSLKNMGASNTLIRRIFFTEGMLISFIGGIIGLSLGAILCILQQHFGIIPMEGNFAVNSFPVEMRLFDFVAIFLLIIGIGFIATLIPVQRISKHYLN